MTKKTVSKKLANNEAIEKATRDQLAAQILYLIQQGLKQVEDMALDLKEKTEKEEDTPIDRERYIIVAFEKLSIAHYFADYLDPEINEWVKKCMEQIMNPSFTDEEEAE